MDRPVLRAAYRIKLGGMLVFVTGISVGSA